jgi:sugar lactone lactonase YvrE
MTFDSDGNMYVIDQTNQRLRKITPTGVTSLIAGNGTALVGQGVGAAASFNFSLTDGICIDSNKNIFITESANNTVRKITPAGSVTAYAGRYNSGGDVNGAAATATFRTPTSIAIDRDDNLYVLDNTGLRVRKITSAGIVSILANISNVLYGTSTGGMVIDTSSNLYIPFFLSGTGGAAGAYVIMVAPNATVTATRITNPPSGFSQPTGIMIDKNDRIYLTSNSNVWSFSSGTVTFIAGSGSIERTLTWVDDAVGINATFNMGQTIFHTACI